MPEFRARVAKAYDDLVALPRENFNLWVGVGCLALVVIAVAKGLI